MSIWGQARQLFPAWFPAGGAGATLEEVFTDAFQGNGWGGVTSRSGQGSDLEETETLRRELPRLVRELGARSLLDAPCGDLTWMREVELGVDEYIGADVVRPLVDHLQTTEANGRCRFVLADITRDPLPAADMILCRDCLVHLPDALVKAALENFRRSGAIYLLTTTFSRRLRNRRRDIRIGEWRTLNLTLPPFSLPQPLRLLNEGYRGKGGAFADKSLGLWRLEDLPDFD